MTRLCISIWCLLATAAQAADEVVIDGGSGNPIVMVDAMYAADCTNDMRLVANTTSPLDIGDADTVDGCSSELLVASESSALALLPRVDFSPADASIPVPLVDRLPVQVFTWVLRRQTLPDTEKNELVGLSEGDLLAADLAFAKARSGIAFEHQGIQFPVDAAWAARVEEAAEDAAEGRVGGQAVLDAIAGNTAHQPKPEGLNVYRLAIPVRGFHIRHQDLTSSGVIVLGTVAEGTTLAHELGHAMSLDHVSFDGIDRAHGISGEYCHAFGEPYYYDGECDFTESNLMWAGGGPGRSHLTLGQALRTAINERSFLNTHSPPLRDPSEPRRSCADWYYDERCPYIGMEPDS